MSSDPVESSAWSTPMERFLQMRLKAVRNELFATLTRHSNEMQMLQSHNLQLSRQIRVLLGFHGEQTPAFEDLDNTLASYHAAD